MSTEVIDLPIKSLWVSDLNVRKDAGDVTELAKSIGEQGLFQPLLVRQETDGRHNGNPVDGAMYGIIIGSRRFAAAKMAKLKKVPVIIKNIQDDEALIISLADNIQRNEVEPIDAAAAVRKLVDDYHYTSRRISDQLGKSQGYVQNLSTTEYLIFKLKDMGVRVAVHASDDERDKHKAVPLMHAVAVAGGFNRRALAPRLKDEPNIDAEMAQKASDVKQKEIINIMNYFEDHPNKSVDDAIAEGKGYTRGSGGGGGSSGTSEGHVDSETKLWHNKLMYNLERNTTKYDFYTIGYSGTDIDLFIERLKSKNVKTLIDVRKNAFSLYKQDFNGQNLSLLLNDCDIGYFHQPEWGIDRELREELDTLEDYQKLWKWYDKNVLGKDLTTSGGLPWNFDQPWAFMCSELDPTKCHRHRIAKHLEENFDMKSMDL